MIAIIFKGILLGVSIALFFGFGPAFFAVFQTALHKGYVKGFLMAFGVFLSDALMVGISMWGAQSVLENSKRYEILGLIGGLILIAFGLYIFKKKTLSTEREEIEELEMELTSSKHPFYVAKGFLLNIANPFIWIFWAGTVMGFSSHMAGFKLIAFFSATLLTIFSFDIIKVIIANKIKPLINDRFLRGINKAAGLMLIIFGLALLIKTLIEYLGIS